MSRVHACSPSTQEVRFRLRVLLHYPASLKPAWAPWVSFENITNKAKRYLKTNKQTNLAYDSTFGRSQEIQIPNVNYCLPLAEQMVEFASLVCNLTENDEITAVYSEYHQKLQNCAL